MTTTDELALLAAVCEHPADDTPRLAYADWLEDHAGGVACMRCAGTGKLYEWTCKVCGATPDEAGCVEHDRGCYQIDPDGGGTEWVEPEGCDKCRGTGTVPDGRASRAEFIRVQCEFATNPNCSTRCMTADRWHYLRRRERELLKGAVAYVNPGYRHAWFPLDLGVRYSTRVHGDTLTLLTGDGPRMSATFRRGFVDEVRCTAADWLTHADRLVWRPGLTDECPRCEGDGKAHGADRACEWSSRPDYNICPVCRCEWCDGTGTERVADAAGDMDDATCRKCGGRKATGRVPRPCPATAHPITKVTLTTLPTAEVGEFNALRKWVRPLEWGGDTRDSFEAEWDWITFTFQGAEDRR